jgi:hypothetical protein
MTSQRDLTGLADLSILFHIPNHLEGVRLAEHQTDAWLTAVLLIICRDRDRQW